MERREDEIRGVARQVFARERLSLLALAGPLFALAVAAAWGRLNLLSPDTWAVGMILSGFATGLMMRLLARGTRPLFYFLSLFLYFVTILFAVSIFDVLSSGRFSTRLMIVVLGIGISASIGFLSFGLSREERWALRNNRGLAQPAGPLISSQKSTLSVVGMIASCGFILGLAHVIYSGFFEEDTNEFVGFGDPPVQYWKTELARDPTLAEDARKKGVSLGLEGSDALCVEQIDARHLDCDTNLCRAERSYLLIGCLDTARAVRDDTEIRW